MFKNGLEFNRREYFDRINADFFATPCLREIEESERRNAHILLRYQNEYLAVLFEKAIADHAARKTGGLHG